MSKQKGFRVYIYDAPYGRDTLSYWPRTITELTLVNQPGKLLVPELTEVTDDAPAAYLKPGHAEGTCIVVPVPKESTNPWFMKGYSFVASSDSRFSRAVEQLTGHIFYGAIPLHDRVE